MPLTITEPAKYTNINPIDFRMKAARTKGLEAQADNYRLDTMAKKKAMAEQAKSAEIFKNVLSDPNLQGKDEESKLQAVGAGFMGAGLYNHWNAVQKSLQDFKKAKIEQQKGQAEYMGKIQSVAQPVVYNLFRNPTKEAIDEAKSNFSYYGENLDPIFNKWNESIDQYEKSIAHIPEGAEKIQMRKEKIQSLGILDDKYTKIKSTDLGRTIHQGTEYDTPQTLVKSQTPATVAANERFQIAEGGRNRRHQENYIQRERIAKENILKAKNKKERKEEEEKLGKLRKGNHAINAATEMWQIAEDNPLAVAGYFTSLISGIHGLKATFMPKTAGINDLAKFKSKTALVAAQAVDLLSGKTRLNSKFGQERLEAAIGVLKQATSKQTIQESIDTIVGLIAEESGAPLPEHFRERLSKLPGYTEDGVFVGTVKDNAQVPDMSIEQFRKLPLSERMKRHGIK